MLSFLNDLVYDLPVPINLNCWWMFGSSIGFILLVQIVTGLVLASHYTNHSEIAFGSVIHIIKDVNYGWLFRGIHQNGASLLFACIYIHIGRGLYYESYSFNKVWFVGWVMMVISMAIAFFGYVLPWSQMSYWGATVITNLFSVVPFCGNRLVEWIWGGYTVCDNTLKRFFLLHILLPFTLFNLMFLHLIYLHKTGSGNPLGVVSDAEKVPFHPMYTYLDLFGITVLSVVWGFMVLHGERYLGEPLTWVPADPYNTPAHIKPEWYFLYAYTILRSVPNNTGGILALFGALFVLLVPLLYRNSIFQGLAFYPLSQIYFWWWVSSFVWMTWLGTCPVEEPFITCGQVATVFYFSYFFLEPFLRFWYDWKVVIEFDDYIDFFEPRGHNWVPKICPLTVNRPFTAEDEGRLKLGYARLMTNALGVNLGEGWE